MMTRSDFISNIVSLHDDMYRLAAAITGSAEDASDAVQDTMLRLWNSRDRIPQDASGRRAYCLKALRSRCLTLLDNRTHAEQLTADAAEESQKADTDMLLNDTQRILKHLVESLPESQRTVLRLMTAENMDTRETARITGFSETNVRQLLSRARKYIKEHYTLLN